MAKTVVLEIAGMRVRAGIENYLMNLLRELNHEEIQVDFLYSADKEGPYDKEIMAYGGRIFRVPPLGVGIKKMYRHFKAVERVLREHPEIKVVHIHGNTAISCVDARVAKKMKIPRIIIHSHSNDCDGMRGRILHLLCRVLVRGCSDVNLCCSEDAGKWMFGNNGRFFVAPNAILLQKYRFDMTIAEQIRSANDWDGCKVIGHIGRMTAPKNHKLIIDLFNKIYEQHPETRLFLIGDGELRGQIQEQVEKYNLSSKVTIISQTDQVEKYLMAMDLFLFPSIWEGLGIVLVEAQASGLPCLVSDAICKEVRVTDLVNVCELTAPVDAWSKLAWEILDGTRTRCSDEYIDILREQGYDSYVAAESMAQNWYTI